MKKLLSILSVMTLSIMLLAQAPQSFTYQTVIRNGSWSILNNQNVGIKIAILEDTPNGTAVYEESHHTITSQIGLVNLSIGEGTIINGVFNTIDWGNHSYFIQVAVDVTGGINYVLMGTTQLRSVPYALYAETSGTPGTPGPQGPPGIDGVDGADGTNGVDGAVGATGPPGANGIDGTNGVDGAVGATGPPGADGIDGTNGATGPQGPAGADGINGTNGVDGVDGIDAVVDYDSLANLISVDSTFITNVGGGIGGGSGCDIQYPEGLDGEPITYDLSSSYTVPAGKNLYITNLYSQSGFFSIDGVNVHHSYSNYNNSGGKTAMPFIAKQGQVLLHSTSAGSFNGFLVDAFVEPITYNLSSSYTVPAGKNLYITNLYSQSGFFSIDGVNVLHSYSNYNQSSKTAMPFIAKQGQVLLHSSSAGSFNGYLVDEDYFENCGGGSQGAQGPTGPAGPAGPSFFTNMQGGSVDIGSEQGLGIKIVAVTFPTPFANPPNVICTASAQPGTIFDDSFNITVRSVTTTGFEMIVNRVDSYSWSQDLDAFWMAFE